MWLIRKIEGKEKSDADFETAMCYSNLDIKNELRNVYLEPSTGRLRNQKFGHNILS